MEKQRTHCTKMGADSLAENTPNAPEFICPFSAQAQKFCISMKKGFIIGLETWQVGQL